MNLPKILVVDDESDNFDVIEVLLGTEKYDLRYAADSEDALSVLDIDPPDLILLDIAMPGVDGVSICQQIKSHPSWKLIPVIIVTALTSKLVLSKCLETGADDFISKPISGLELKARVRSMLRIRKQHQQLTQFNLHLEATVQERTEQLNNIIAQDRLTQLPSRNYLLTRLSECLAELSDTTLAVINLDCDQFQLVNGSFGHAFGDRLLIAIATRLKQLIRPRDILARLGEDEFCWVVNPIQRPHVSEIEPFIEAIRGCFNQPFWVEGCEIYMSASMGVAFSQSDKQTASELFQSADTAMYQAKSKGHGHYQIFSPSMSTQIQNRLMLEADLQRAINHQEFIVFYQPIIELETLKTVGFEALTRWQHPHKGLIAPGAFIPSLEATGLIEPVGILIFEQACQQLRRWHQKGFPHLTMSINVSPRQFNSPSLLEDIRDILKKTQVNPACLKLEITESAIMSNVKNAIALTQQLQASQIQVSIDDFGTGYSSLKYLNSFAVDNLKIDRSFVNEFTSAKARYPIVNTIITLSQELGLSIIAEGIETQTQLAWLQDLRCDFGQGYLFSKPLCAQEIEQKFLS